MTISLATTVLAALACLAYAAATLQQVSAYRNSDSLRIAAITKLPLLGIAAFIFHAAYTAIDASQHQGISTSFFDALSITALIVVAMALCMQFRHPIQSLYIPVFSIAIICLLLASTSHGHTPISASSKGMLFHIVSSIVGYSLLSLATVQAIIVQIIERALKHHQNTALNNLPPLQTMEALLFQLVGLGWLALTVAIASGVFFIDNLFEQNIAHKTLFSVLSWLMFGLLLLGRELWGWRSSTAVRWTFAAFGLLVLGYFGSKFVLEIILHR